MNGSIKAQLSEQLKRHEGLRLKPYRCTAGKLSIGVGRNLDDCGISEDEAMVMHENDMEHCEDELLEHIPEIYNGLNDARKTVLLNMCFNMGIGGLLSFKNTLARIASGEFSKAAEGMMSSKWAKQVHSRANELSEIMRTGKIQ